MKNTKGQVAIFIIIGILIFLALAVFFLARGTKIIIPTGSEFSPERYIGSCVRQSVRDTIEIMLPQGGVFAPTDFNLVNQTKVAYLCKNINYYAPCINQYPRYIYHLQEEVRKNIEGEVAGCFNALKAELERRNYEVNKGAHSVRVALKPEVAEVSIPVKLALKKNGQVQTISEITANVRSPLHEIGLVVNEIVSQEAQYCYFEYVGYMILYPDWDIRVMTRSDATKVYTVTHMPTDTTLQFAVRGCAFPAGI